MYNLLKLISSNLEWSSIGYFCCQQSRFWSFKITYTINCLYGFYEIYSDVRYAGRQTGDFPDDAVVLPGCLETEKSLVI